MSAPTFGGAFLLPVGIRRRNERGQHVHKSPAHERVTGRQAAWLLWTVGTSFDPKRGAPGGSYAARIPRLVSQRRTVRATKERTARGTISHNRKGIDVQPKWYSQSPDWIIDEYGQRLGPNGIALYHALNRLANQDGECFPSHETLAAMTGMSVRTVVNTIPCIVALGLIRKRGRVNERGLQTSDEYTVLFTVHRGSTARPGMQDMHTKYRNTAQAYSERMRPDGSTEHAAAVAGEYDGYELPY
jgi:hypothetical protein